MKQVFEIISDEDEQINQSKPIFITLFQQSINQKWKIDSRFKHISGYLQHMQQSYDQMQNSIFIAPIPSDLTLTSYILWFITQFYQKHNFNEENIKIDKISLEGYENAVDPISLKFLQTSIKSLSEQCIKSLFRVCQFLKLNRLKQLVCLHIANQHFFEFNNVALQKKLQENYAFYSRHEQIQLSKKMKKYAQQLSMDLLQRLRQKHQRQNMILDRN